MRVLLLNLTRFGDLLQTQATVTDLHRQGHEVGMLCQENFSRAAALIRNLREVFPLTGSSLLAKIHSSWQEALSGVVALRKELDDSFSPEVVNNISPNISAQVLSRFIAGKNSAWGFSMDSHGFDHNSSPWGAFLEGASRARGGSPYNIIDVFRQVGRDPEGDVAVASRSLSLPGNAVGAPLFKPGDSLLKKPDDASLEAAKALLQAQSPPECAGFVAFQLGASESRRQWPAHHFAELGRILWEEARLCPVLLGAKSEEDLANGYRVAAQHPHISLTGQTDLTQLAATLCHMRLLVTNDTGTMHLAAGLGVPLLAIFLATAQPFDTGPSLAGSCSLEPDLACHPCAFGVECPYDHKCRENILPAVVGRLCLGFIAENAWRLPKSPGCRAWVTGHDELGYIRLSSISGHETEDRSLWLAELARILRQFIDRDKKQAFIYPISDRCIPFSADTTKTLGRELREITGFLTLLGTQGRVLTQKDLPPMRQKFMDSWAMVQRLLKASPYLGSLEGLWLEETQGKKHDFSFILNIIDQYHALFRGFSDRLPLS